MKSKYILTLAIAAALPAIALIAQVPPHGPMKGMIKGDKSKTMEMPQKMEADMKARDAELERLVAEMNSAAADKKVDAIAAVVTKLVEQQKAMHSQMGAMHGGMMGHQMMGMPENNPTPSGE